MLNTVASPPSSSAQIAAQQACASLPSHLASVVWPGHLLGSGERQVWPSGHGALDAELPGGGWPARAVSELLLAQPGQAEWRLLLPTLQQVANAGGHVVLVAPPFVPHLPGLAQQGLPPEKVIRLEARTPQERLWVTEQTLLADGLWAVVSWLPQARPEQIRRLQACAAAHQGPAFLLRPARAAHEPSAAPLRIHLSLGPCPHPIRLDILKRRGPLRDGPIWLSTWPPAMHAILPPHPLPSADRVSAPTPHHAPLDRPAARTPPGDEAPVRRSPRHKRHAARSPL
jgi:protein ImuA